MLIKLVTKGYKSYSSIKDAGFTLLKIEQLQLITFYIQNQDTLIEQSCKIVIDKWYSHVYLTWKEFTLL